MKQKYLERTDFKYATVIVMGHPVIYSISVATTFIQYQWRLQGIYMPM